MKQKNFFKIALTLFLSIRAINSFGQIYNADFSTNGNGFADHTISSPPAAVPASVGPFGSSGNQWSLSYTSAPSTDTTANIFKVVGGKLKSDDWGGQGIFQSQSIDVSAISTIDISASSVNVGANDNTFKYFYILDGGSRVESSNISSSNGGSVNYTITNLDVSGATTLVVGFEFSENGAGSGYETSSFTVTSVGGPTTPGISLTAVSGKTNESGTTATFTAVLNTQPASNVVLNISSADLGEVTVSPTTLTFTTGNWNVAQTVTLTGVDDVLFDGNKDVVITVSVDVGNSDGDYAAEADVTTTITNEDDDFPKIIISEIMYNTPTVYGSDDEWIELYNADGSAVDISGWTLIYNSITFTFPSSTTIVDNSYIVIAVGSNGDGIFNGDNPFTPDFNNLSVSNANVAITDNTNNLTNTTRTIELKDGAIVIDSVIYNIVDNSETNGSGSSFEIIDISSDNSATSDNWQGSLVNGGSPKRISGSTWTGAISSDWSTAGNWIVGIPIPTSDVLIPSGLINYPTVATAATVNSLIMNSGSSLIAQDAFTGNVTYNRALAYNALLTEGWHLVSSPVVGETYDGTYVTANGLATNGNNNAIATYTTASNTWSYMQTGGGGTFAPGIGYSVKKQSIAGDISFTGTINTSDVSVGVVTGGTNSFNLIGNPFTSYLNSVDFINGNSGNLATNEIWVFNQSTSNYEVKNLASEFKLTPAQGFFVRANAATNLTIAESYQASTGDTFQKTSKTEITLNMTEGAKNRFAKIYYLDNATTGFDNGYDGETFGGVVNSVDVFTHLVANSTGKKYQVQSLPNSDFENMVVPVGVKAAAGKEITFSLEAMNTPDGINVYLEDKATNTVKLLSEANATYKVTLSEALDGIGRFYLHTKASGVLGTDTIALGNVSIYSTDASTLRIAGLSEGKASVKIFSILGKQVFENSFNASAVKDMQLPKLANGIYVVQLATEKGTKHKKITLE